MDRRKFLIGMGSLAAGGAAASGTGAFSAARLSRSASVGIANDSNAFIQLVTGGAEGAEKRVKRSAGEFQIDFGASGSGNGVNDDSRYQIGAMDDDAAGDQLDEGTGSATEFKSLYDEDTQPSAKPPGTPYAPDSDTDQSAFVVRNRSGQLLNVQIGYRLPDTDERSNEDDDGAILFLQGHASAIEAGNNNANTETDSAVATGAFDFAANSGQPGELDVLSYQEGNVSGNEALPAGEEIYVSLQVDTTRAETDAGETNLDGSLVVSAEKAALPTSGG